MILVNEHMKALSLLLVLQTTVRSVNGFVFPCVVNEQLPTHRGESSLARFVQKDNDETRIDNYNDAADGKRRNLMYNVVGAGLLAASGVSATFLFKSSVYTPSGFTRIPTQFIAALGDPKTSQGNNAKTWGIWALDPGPRGVWLKDYSATLASGDRVAPSGWKFDPNDWWLEEHGLIMESPYFPLPPGRYLVTGGRMVTTGLTIASDGTWMLDDGNSLYDVTHLPCRSARYTPLVDATTTTTNQNDKNHDNNNILGSPLTANPRDFPVAPGAEMPKVPGCTKQDYAVLFVVGKATG